MAGAFTAFNWVNPLTEVTAVSPGNLSEEATTYAFMVPSPFTVKGLSYTMGCGLLFSMYPKVSPGFGERSVTNAPDKSDWY